MGETTSGAVEALTFVPAYRGAFHRAGHFGPDPLAHASYAAGRCADHLSAFSSSAAIVSRYFWMFNLHRVIISDRTLKLFRR
jgi:hypothetical protein